MVRVRHDGLGSGQYQSIDREQDPACGFSDCSLADQYPLFGLGVGVAVGGVIQRLMIIMIAAYIRARADGSMATPSTFGHLGDVHNEDPHPGAPTADAPRVSR